MKKNIIFFFSLLFLFSCSQSELENEQLKTISGTINESDVPQTINLGDRTMVVTFVPDSIDINNSQLKAGFVGPYYSTGNMILASKNEKVIIRSGDKGIPTGAYICEVYCFTQQVKLPADAVVARVDIPSPAGYSNYSTQTKGVNWTMTTNTTGTYLSFTFYTLIVKYDMAGRFLGYVIPMDGRKIQVPYFFFKY
ncbi:MAG: hypothetical protein RL662_1976 [Bacteroidota bacterium]|jgi:hypothetical protein